MNIINPDMCDSGWIKVWNIKLLYSLFKTGKIHVDKAIENNPGKKQILGWISSALTCSAVFTSFTAAHKLRMITHYNK